MPQPDHLMIVDDDAEIRELLGRALLQEGFEVTTCANVSEMREQISNCTPDLIIMDLMMPGEDGITATQKLRREQDTPVVMLTAKCEDVDKIVGLEIGADDYISKPFNTRELVARIRAVLRRHRSVTPQQTHPKQEHPVYRFEGWTFNILKRELHTPTGTLCAITSGEFDLLKAFVLSPREILSRETLINETRGKPMQTFDRSIDIQVSRLRNKIEHDPKMPQIIKTIHNRGYMFTSEVDIG